ncbi:hypothetical protein ACFL1M_04245 [Patescibacteria group bacterium]
MANILGLLLLAIPSVKIAKWFEGTIFQKTSAGLLSFVLLNPFVVFIIHSLIKTPLTTNLFLCASVITALITLLLKKSKPTKENKIKISLIVLTFITVIPLLISYLPASKPIIGGDTQHYLLSSGYIIKNKLLRTNFDRSIVHIFPAILYSLTSISIENGIKIMVSLTFISFSLSLFKIFNKSTKNHLASTLLLFPVLLTEPITDLSFFIIALFIAYSVLIKIVDILSKKKLNNKNLIFTIFLWICLFNLHIQIAISSIIIIPIVFLINKRQFKINKKLLIVLPLSILIFSGIGLKRYWKNGVIKANISTFGSKIFPSLIKKSESVYSTSWLAKDLPSLLNFPYHRLAYKKHYSIVIFLLFMLGMGGVFGEHKKNLRIKTYAAIAIILFLVTQQSYLGLDLLSGRFVLLLSPFIILFAYIGLFRLLKLSSRQKKKKLAPISAFIILLVFIPKTYKNLKELRSTVPTIEQAEYGTIKNISKFVGQNTPIFTIIPTQNWAQGLNPHHTFIRIKTSVMCSNDPEIKRTTQRTHWDINTAFFKDTNQKKSVEILSKIAKTQDYYIVLDIKSYWCINPDVVSPPEYKIISEDDGYYLLKHKAS